MFRSLLLVLLFLGFLGASIALTIDLVMTEIPGLLGVVTGSPISAWHALATVALAVPLLFGAAYAGGLLWLLAACYLFRRDEVEWFVKAGPHTRLEIRLLERFSRD